jgi:hypothetical protein
MSDLRGHFVLDFKNQIGGVPPIYSVRVVIVGLTGFLSKTHANRKSTQLSRQNVVIPGNQGPTRRF